MIAARISTFWKGKRKVVSMMMMVMLSEDKSNVPRILSKKKKWKVYCMIVADRMRRRDAMCGVAIGCDGCCGGGRVFTSAGYCGCGGDNVEG
eukprot:12318629-Ditylum_brightwellii.AAC.1